MHKASRKAEPVEHSIGYREREYTSMQYTSTRHARALSRLVPPAPQLSPDHHLKTENVASFFCHRPRHAMHFLSFQVAS